MNTEPRPVPRTNVIPIDVAAKRAIAHPGAAGLQPSLEDKISTVIATWLVDDIDVIAISDHEWRISDRTRSEYDAISLLGFVQVVGKRYELTALGSPLVRQYFPNLDAAVRSLVRSKRAA